MGIPGKTKNGWIFLSFGVQIIWMKHQCQTMGIYGESGTNADWKRQEMHGIFTEASLDAGGEIENYLLKMMN